MEYLRKHRDVTVIRGSIQKRKAITRRINREFKRAHPSFPALAMGACKCE